MKNKVPQVTLAFWIIKIAATTLGETGGDALSMTLNLGYAISTAIFFAFFVATAAAQIASSKLHRFLYWTVIVATTTVGTTTSDYLTRSAGLGYLWASIILLAGVLIVLAIWFFALGSVNVNKITNRKAETFYWLTILTSNTLGTALGDCVADTSLGYEGGALNLRRRARCGRSALLFHERLTGGALLDRVRSHAPARRHPWRYSDEAARRRWAESQPVHVHLGDRSRDDRLHSPLHRALRGGCRDAETQLIQQLHSEVADEGARLFGVANLVP